MTAHDHTEIVPSCFRCEIGADETNPAFDWPRPRRSRLDDIAARLEAPRAYPESMLLDGPMADLAALLAVVREVAALHRAMPIYEPDDLCQHVHVSEDDGECEHCGERHTTSADGEAMLCLDLPTGHTVCAECRDEYGEGFVAWPCPTATALNGLEETDGR